MTSNCHRSSLNPVKPLLKTSLRNLVRTLLKCSALQWAALQELEHSGTFNLMPLVEALTKAKVQLEELVLLLEEHLPEEM